MPQAQLTKKEVAKHNTSNDCWIIIGQAGSEKVYDVTKFLSEHPGGPEIMMEFAGKNADDMFEDVGHSRSARSRLASLYIGDLQVE